MKKTYTKPMLYAESFSLVEHIASCTTAEGISTVSYRDGNSCTYTAGGITLFNYNVTGCSQGYYEGENDPMFDDYQQFLQSLREMKGGGCYNVFNDGNFFAS